MLNSVPWSLEKLEMDTMLHMADKLIPPSSEKKKRLPYMPEFIVALRQQLDLNVPLDAATFTCLVTCFYASARLCKFTMHTLQSFNPGTHVTIQNLSHDQDCSGHRVTMLHLPRTKMAGNEGKDVFWASQEGDTDPTNHLRHPTSSLIK
jgi:hypothetical protein